MAHRHGTTTAHDSGIDGEMEGEMGKREGMDKFDENVGEDS